MQKSFLNLLCFCSLFVSAVVFSADGWKPTQVLKPVDEAKWIANVKNHRTSDGSSVREVLAYVEKMRRSQFKVEKFDIGYNGATGKPDFVSISYWIGKNRKDGDQFVDLGYPMTKEGVIATLDLKDQPMLSALEKGRDAFLREVDAFYAENCLQPGSAEKSC
ncbi:hypothetical protein [Collimonas humicola]|uniref:hypothetical protein n=1 Tax=Collimonas humicola TaxID=2825886 RepID=UPI001B8ADCE6|nr:hypothetical protein [Collimonas humicola]